MTHWPVRPGVRDRGKMMTLYHLAGAFILAYFARTLVMLLPLSRRTTVALAKLHLLAFTVIAAVLVAIRLPLGVFATSQLLPCAAAQTFWFLFDAMVRQSMRARRSAGA